jgi:CDP-glucose 4,6-dehydratase
LSSLIGIEGMCASHILDIRDLPAIKRCIKTADPEIVFHLAAQPLVLQSYREPIDTFSTNVMGTVNILEAMRDSVSLKAAVMVTTDKVYQNNEWVYPYRETDALGGHDPYSASKAASEIVIASYRASFLSQQGAAVATARAGNVIGGGDWSVDRLVPDAIRAWQANQTLHIRRPLAIRPWQHVLEPLVGYLTLAEQIYVEPSKADAYNFGPAPDEAATVREVIDFAIAMFDSGKVAYGDGQEGPHEAGWLALETSKARLALGYHPRWNLKDSVTRTITWYQKLHSGASAKELCLEDILAFNATTVRN